MPRVQPTVFVLWGDRCDELAACTFVTVFRRAGLRVKLVGVSGRRNKGACGLTLTPDLPLHEAFPLASHATAVVIPCEKETLRRILQDTRLAHFLEAAGAGRSHIVVQAGAVEQLSLALRQRCVTYLADDQLQGVAGELVLIFSTREARRAK
ncbi:MAG: hypothetical protein DCC55_15545 [Chloroflexi bacterium]|nr:MAG: hypothetical protein DCC55_15545 [Chloroflexota bacterium]